MYNLPHHKENNSEIVKEFIARYPFAFLSGCDAENKPIATQIPLFLEEEDGKVFLRGHFMKNTDHHKAFVHNPNVLAVFTGHHTYVSATWYSTPNIPSTWNYMSVHVKGIIRILDEEGLISVLQKTSLHFENYNENSPTVYSNISEQLKNRLLSMIVAFEMEITEIDTVFKLSQDRDRQSYQNIIKMLEEQGEDGKVIAHEMKIREELVF